MTPPARETGFAPTLGVTRIPPEVIVFRPESETVAGAAAWKRRLLVVAPPTAPDVVTVVFDAPDHASLVYAVNGMMLPALTVAQLVARLVVAQPPRMSFAPLAEVVVMAPAVGSTKS